MTIRFEDGETRGIVYTETSRVLVKREGDLYAVKMQKFADKPARGGNCRVLESMLSKDEAENLAAEIEAAYNRGDKVFYVKEV